MSNNHYLAIRPGGIGDCILSFPALEHLRESHLEVWVPSAVVPLVRFADRVGSISGTGLDLVGLPGLEPPKQLMERLESFDQIHSWYGGNREDFIAATANCRIHFHKSLPSPDGAAHAADFFANQVGAPQPAIPRIDIGKVSKRDFIAIHPFSGGPKKNWPHFAELAKQLPMPVEWCASAHQPALISEDLGKVAAWLAEAKLYIGNDSGITHLAAAVGTPVIAIFQHSNPRLWAPRGEHVTILESPGIADVLKAANNQATGSRSRV